MLEYVTLMVITVIFLVTYNFPCEMENIRKFPEVNLIERYDIMDYYSFFFIFLQISTLEKNREDLSSTIASLKVRINQLTQKCKEKVTYL